MPKVVITGALRTAIGSFGGSLSSMTPAELGTIVAQEVLKRGSTPQNTIDEVIVGNVLGAGHGMNIARQITLKSGLPVSTPAYTVNKVCGSGLKAIALGAQAIQSSEASCIVAGGVESMSQAGFISLSQRWGSRLGNSDLKDMILQDGLTDVFHACHMGITAENLATRFEISRKEQDAFAAESQSKAVTAIKAGIFKDEIVPIPLMKKGKQVGVFEVDEYPRPDTTVETLSGLKPAFKSDGTVTAGNASGINDGASFVMLMSDTKAKDLALKPLAEIVAWSSAGVAPEVMGLGPVEAVQRLTEKTKISLSQIDCIEANEAFAAQAIAVNRSLKWDTSKVNPNGGAIALGHPIGASGARILVTLLHQMRRTNKEYGIATLCVGGGQGIAVLLRCL